MGLGDSARNIVFKFIGSSKSLEKASARSARSLGKLDKKVTGTSKGLGFMQKAAGALGATMLAGKFAQGISSAVMRAQEMDSKYAITAKIIKETGGAANLTGEQIREMSKEMSMATGLDKAVVSDAANVLLTFKEIRNVAGENNDLFTRALEITGDMATVFGGSAKDAAKQLGKALNDPIGGISALSRVGVQFTEDQKEVIKSLVKTGDVAGAQKVILKELESQVGGTAEASADATEKMARSWDEVAEAVGKELLPVLDGLVIVLGEVAQSADGGTSALHDFVTAGLKAGQTFSIVTDDAESLRDRADALREVMSDFTKTNLSLIPVLGDGLSGAFNTLETAVGLAGDKFDTVQVSMENVRQIAGGQYGSSMRAAESATLDTKDAVEGLGSALKTTDEIMDIFSDAMFEKAKRVKEAAAEIARANQLLAGGGGSGEGDFDDAVISSLQRSQRRGAVSRIVG